MTDILRDQDGTVVYEHPITDTLSADVLNASGTILASALTVTSSAGRHEITVPWSCTEYDATLTIKWYNADSSFVRYSSVDVVTPVISASVLSTILPSWTQDDRDDLERAIRHTIQAYTGQAFGKRQEVIRVTATGDQKLKLPYRLITINSVTDVYYSTALDLTQYGVYGDGWFFGHNPQPDDDAYEPWNVIPDTTAGNVIVVPSFTYLGAFKQDWRYDIDGVWGYDAVPEEVQVAAKILVNDYSANGSAWRDRYVEAISSGDWSMDFNPGAYLGTGNAKVDNLLEPFKKIGWSTI